MGGTCDRRSKELHMQYIFELPLPTQSSFRVPNTPLRSRVNDNSAALHGSVDS
jgi:hypothetical protein